MAEMYPTHISLSQFTSDLIVHLLIRLLQMGNFSIMQFYNSKKKHAFHDAGKCIKQLGTPVLELY